jgi:hypothetical protein
LIASCFSSQENKKQSTAPAVIPEKKPASGPFVTDESHRTAERVLQLTYHQPQGAAVAVLFALAFDPGNIIRHIDKIGQGKKALPPT